MVVYVTAILFLTHTHAKFYPEFESFTKHGKIVWVKYWWMTFNSPNSPKSSSATILNHTVATYNKLCNYTYVY